jgi:AraC family transcriptional regulator
MNYAIVRKELSPQPVLLVRRRVQRSEIAATLGPIFGSVVECAHKRGAALSGQPFTRFVAWGPGLLTIEAGLPIATAVTGIGEVEADSLPGGPVATTTHKGPYDQLTQAYAALELWIQEHGWRAGATPWEVYVTDPAEHPDPQDWRTEVFWPIAPS